MSGERASTWWNQLRQWEKDEVQDWWNHPDVAFPLSAGMKQTAAGLGDYDEGSMSEPATIFLRDQLGLRPGAAATLPQHDAPAPT